MELNITNISNTILLLPIPRTVHISLLLALFASDSSASPLLLLLAVNNRMSFSVRLRRSKSPNDNGRSFFFPSFSSFFFLFSSSIFC